MIIEITLRLLIALVLGGIIGIEREYRSKDAGFRTHFLVALGSALFCIVSQYGFGFDLKDSSRVAAQVVSGIGFLGAGTIIFQKNVVRGLTTAAGLWTCAIIGLAIGAGYFEAAVLSTVVILLAEIFFSRFEYWVLDNARNINIFVEYSGTDNLDNVIRTLKTYRVIILDLEITKSGQNSCAIFQLQLPKKLSHDKIMTIVSTSDGVISVEEL